MVFNVPPLGCFPGFLANACVRNMSTVDTYGCLATVNGAIEATNSFIQTGLDDLRGKHRDATIICADLYRILSALFRKGTSYGFKETLEACCGAGGGAYNYYQDATCGASVVVNGQLIQAEACSDPGSYIH